MPTKPTYWVRSKQLNEIGTFGRRPVPARFKTPSNRNENFVVNGIGVQLIGVNQSGFPHAVSDRWNRRLTNLAESHGVNPSTVWN